VGTCCLCLGREVDKGGKKACGGVGKGKRTERQGRGGKGGKERLMPGGTEA
jgi:hypothetical protein